MRAVLRQAARWLRGRRDAVERARALGVRVGRDCRFYACDFGDAPELVSIGDHVTLPNGVEIQMEVSRKEDVSGVGAESAGPNGQWGDGDDIRSF